MLSSFQFCSIFMECHKTGGNLKELWNLSLSLSLFFFFPRWKLVIKHDSFILSHGHFSSMTLCFSQPWLIRFFIRFLCDNSSETCWKLSAALLQGVCHRQRNDSGKCCIGKEKLVSTWKPYKELILDSILLTRDILTCSLLLWAEASSDVSGSFLWHGISFLV